MATIAVVIGGCMMSFKKIAIFTTGCLLSLITMHSQAAHATEPTGWPKQLTQIAENRIHVHDGGGLTASCGNFATTNAALNTYSLAFYPNLDSGQIVGYGLAGRPYIPSTNGIGFSPGLTLANCPASMGPSTYVQSNDGKTLYTAAYRKTSTNLSLDPSEMDMVAMSNNRELWSTKIPSCSANPNRLWQSTSIIRGANNDIYGVFHISSSPDCNMRLIGFNANTGSIKFNKDLGVSSSTAYTNSTYLWSYTDTSNNSGLIVNVKKATAYPSGISELRYFDYSGNEDTSKVYDFREDDEQTTYIGKSGRVYQQPRPTGWCPGGAQRSFDYHDPNGTSGSINVNPANVCFSGYTVNSYAYPLSNGNVAFLNDKTQVILYDSSGNQLSSSNLTFPSGYGPEYPGKMIADDAGNLIVVSSVKQWSPISEHVIVHKVAPNGTVSELYNTQSLGSGTRYTSYATPVVKNGYLYLIMCHNGCSDTNLRYIHKIPVSGVSEQFMIDGNAPESQTVDRDSDGLTAAQEASQGTSDASKDTDNDGLSDYIESQWYPIRLAVFCAPSGSPCATPHPTEKDVYVEIDWMKDMSNREFKPTAYQLGYVENMFANKGIHFYADTGQYGGGNLVAPYIQPLVLTSDPLVTDFGDIKAASFATNREDIWRYLVYGYNYSEAPTSSGRAEVSGTDIFISGGLIEDSTGLASKDRAIAGTIAHEIGHTLCLSDTQTFEEQPSECVYNAIDSNTNKPLAYLSVMNYRYQLTDQGDMGVVDYSDGSGGTGDHNDWAAVELGMHFYSNSKTNINSGAPINTDKPMDPALLSHELPIKGGEETLRRHEEQERVNLSSESNNMENENSEPLPLLRTKDYGDNESMQTSEQNLWTLGAGAGLTFVSIGSVIWYVMYRHRK